MERFEDVIQEFVDFINQQGGMYMDALAGFSGHKIKVSRQVARAIRPIKEKTGEDGERVVVSSSYEVEGEPDVVIHRTIRAKDFISRNSQNGFNEQQQVRAILVFIFSYWEKEIRPRLAACKGVDTDAISSDIMGDIRLLRIAILHKKGILPKSEYEKLKKISELVVSDEPVHLPYEHMHKVFILIKQDLFRLLTEYLGADDGTVLPEDIVGFTVQGGPRDKT